jgi:hypothetical protein
MWADKPQEKPKPLKVQYGTKLYFNGKEWINEEEKK